MLVQSLNFGVVFVSHVNDDGKTQGSRSISKIAHTWIHLDQNVAAETEEARNTTYLTVRKNRAAHHADRQQVVERIEAEVGIERRQGTDGGTREQQGAAIGSSPHHGLRTDRSARAGAALDDERRAQFATQSVRDDSRQDVERAASREWNNEAREGNRPSPCAWASGPGPLQAVAMRSIALRRESRMPLSAAHPAAPGGLQNRGRASIIRAPIVMILQLLAPCEAQPRGTLLLRKVPSLPDD